MMPVKIIVFIVLVTVYGCSTSLKLAVPDRFKDEATMQHVNGARGNKMSVGNFASSKIKRGMHLRYPGRSHNFFLENLLFNMVGIQKNEIVQKEKARFTYTLSDGKSAVEIYGEEKELSRSLEYKLLPAKRGILNSYTRLQEYQYIFSVYINGSSPGMEKGWELVLTNLYDRQKENDTRLFTVRKADDNGLATNGTDTIFIKPVSIRETETSDGKKGKLPFSVLSGYELSGPGGVLAIIDLIGHNIWFYNELDSTERLTISAIATAIFARKVNDTKW